jgi:hypothetical protein
MAVRGFQNAWRCRDTIRDALAGIIFLQTDALGAASMCGANLALALMPLPKETKGISHLRVIYVRWSLVMLLLESTRERERHEL